MRSSALKASDRVLVRNLTPRGKPGKPRSFREKDVHIVVKRHGDSSPVYDVKPKIGTGAIHTCIAITYLLMISFNLIHGKIFLRLQEIDHMLNIRVTQQLLPAMTMMMWSDDLPHPVPVFDHGCRSLLCQCVLAPSLKFLLTLDSCILEKVLRYLPLASYLQYLCGWYHKLFLFSQIIVLKVKDLLYF